MGIRAVEKENRGTAREKMKDRITWRSRSEKEEEAWTNLLRNEKKGDDFICLENTRTATAARAVPLRWLKGRRPVVSYPIGWRTVRGETKTTAAAIVDQLSASKPDTPKKSGKKVFTLDLPGSPPLIFHGCSFRDIFEGQLLFFPFPLHFMRALMTKTVAEVFCSVGNKTN